MIGQVMLYTAAVGGLVFLAAAAAASYLRRHGRAERGVWVGALILSLALPFGVMARGGASTSRGSSVSTVTYVLERSTDEGPEPLAAPAPTGGLSTEFALLWVVASLALAARWAVSGMRLNRLSRSWRVGQLDGAEVHLTQDFGPAVTGVLNPRIVLPAWVAELPAEKRRLVVRHEVEHLRAGDPLVIAAGRLARVLTPWNPVVWILHSRLAQAVELDCDRRVLRSYPDVASYGETLLAVSAGSRALAPVAAFAESHVPLRRRILAMTTPPTKLKLLGTLGVVAIAAALLAGAVRVPAPRMDLSLDVTFRALTALRSARQEAALPPPRVISSPTRYPLVIVITGTNADTTTLAVRLPDGQTFAGSRPDVDSLFDSVAASTDGPVLLRYGFDPFRDPNLRTVDEVTRGPRILNSEEVIQATAAAYPVRLRERAATGTVAVQFLLTETGEVRHTRIGQISMYPDFDEAALEVAQTYRFSPAELDGEPVPVWVVHPVVFRIE